MTIHEFGKENAESILLIHPSVVRWDYFEYVIPFLEKEYHLIVPALPGYDLEVESDFTSVERIADELNLWLKKNGYERLYTVYGCSKGGSIAPWKCGSHRPLCYGWRRHALPAFVDHHQVDSGQGFPELFADMVRG